MKGGCAPSIKGRGADQKMYIFTLLEGILKIGCQELLKFVGPYLAVMFDIPLGIYDVNFIQTAITYSCILATVLLCLKVLNDLFQTYALGLGDADHSPTIITRRAVFALVAIWATPSIVMILIHLANTVNFDIMNMFNGISNATILDALNDVNKNWFYDVGGQSILFYLAMGVIVIVVLIIVVFSLVKRAVELMLMQIVGPIFAVSLAGNNQQTSQYWLRHLISLTVGQCIQVFMARGLLYLLVTPADKIASTFSCPLPLAWLFTLAWAGLTIFIPSFLAKFVNAGGGGGHGASMTFQAVNSGMAALRSLK